MTTPDRSGALATTPAVALVPALPARASSVSLRLGLDLRARVAAVLELLVVVVVLLITGAGPPI
jgi:hypothetical protein